MISNKYNFIVDSHCHLDLISEHFNIDSVIKEATDNNVKILNTIGTSKANLNKVIEYANNYSNVYCTVGVHPLEVLTEKDILKKDDLIKLKQDNKKIIGFGETGLDYYKDTGTKLIQRDSFYEHIYASIESSTPLVIHVRDADLDLMNIIDDCKNNMFTGLLHCFTSSKELAQKALDNGLYISLSGILTFKNAKDLHDVAKFLPIERILIETDAPYLAPVPFRGKTNVPSYVIHTAKFLAELKNLAQEDVIHHTTNNFINLFALTEI
jgi:TatD DNase family protein